MDVNDGSTNKCFIRLHRCCIIFLFNTFLINVFILHSKCTDETTPDEEPSTVSLRREIPIIDVNDNLPLFGSTQYSFSISEGTKIGTVVYNNITISDKDFGLNSMVNLFCVQSLDCRVFSISLQIVSFNYFISIMN